MHNAKMIASIWSDLSFDFSRAGWAMVSNSGANSVCAECSSAMCGVSSPMCVESPRICVESPLMCVESRPICQSIRSAALLANLNQQPFANKPLKLPVRDEADAVRDEAPCARAEAPPVADH